MNSIKLENGKIVQFNSYTNLGLALMVAQERGYYIILGDNNKYWICSSTRSYSRLRNAGYEALDKWTGETIQ